MRGVKSERVERIYFGELKFGPILPVKNLRPNVDHSSHFDEIHNCMCLEKHATNER